MITWLRAALAGILLTLGLPAFGQGTPVSTPVGLWEFSTAGSLGQATIGPNLAIEGAAPAYAAAVTDGGGVSQSGVMTTVGGTANRLRLVHGIPANSGAYVTKYTLLYDIFSPASSRSSWRCLFQSNGGNTTDGDYFIRNSDDRLGTQALGYSSSSLDDTRWKRVVIVGDLPAVRVYVDGVLFHTHSNQALDGRYALDPQLLLFADESNENASLHVNAVAMWGKALSAAEIQALGAAGAPIQGATLPNQAPVITEGAAFSMPDATLNGPAVTAALHATDAEGNNITWSVSTPAGHGAAEITTSSNAEATIRYTPAAGYFGVDTFQIRVTDGNAADTIDVTVLVRDPNALPWPAPVGLWEFDFAVQPTMATIGQDLVAQGNGFSAVAGAFADDGAQGRPAGNSYRVTNPVGANGGGSYSNRYTILWDVFIPTTAAGQWKTLLQTQASNGNDGDLFINTDGRLGTQAGLGGYSGNSLSAGNWHRVVMRVINGQSSGATIWVNGGKWYTATTNGGVDGRYGLEGQFLFFADDSGEDGTIHVTNVAMWNDAISDAAIIALGSATGRLTNLPKPDANYPPVITEGDTHPLNVQMNATAQATFHVTDEDGDAIAWTIPTGPAHGTAQVTASTNAQATITYTPATNYNGPDAFTVRASDGPAADDIAVTVSVQNGAPVISEGETYLLSALKNGGARTVTFHAVDPNGNPLTWSISDAPAHGAAEITGENTSATLSYTPATDYSGPDSMTVTVTDGAASDSIVINATIADPTANPKLTIVAPHGLANPAPGVYSHPRGTSLTNSVADEISADTRHLVTGWTMTGDGPAAGTDDTMTMTLTRDSVLTWLFRTEYRLETAVSGGGTVNIQSGWFEAGLPLQITATPAPGQYFVGWSGDTEGCQAGGKSIVVPMDRPRGPITANFAVNEDFMFIAIPDTQNYTSLSSPTDLFARQTQWLVNNRETLNIKFVTHLGDVVNSPSNQSQWLRATTAMNLMNGQLPYGTCPGNHDLASGDTNYVTRFGPNPTHSSSVGRWIDQSTSQNYSWYRGASPRGYSSYQIVKVNGRDYMFLHLDMDCPDQDMAWAAGVLAAHPKTLTMITTHNYLAETGGTGIFGSGTGQRGYTAGPNISIGPDRNRPQEIFDNLVKPFNQVYMVICGHMFATYNLQKLNNAGNVVHEVVVDWQSLPNGGNGFLRLMEFRPAQNEIHNTSYSPYLGRYIDPNNNADHQGMLDLHDRYGSEFTLTTDFETRFHNTLTINSPHGGVFPPVGSHAYEDGTPVVISAQEQIVGQTRYRPIGWNLTGSQTASGAGASATITHQGDATVTWSYATEHYLTTSTIGAGLVSTSSGWYAAGSVVNVQAQPDVGADFVQWSGDIEGCTIAGANISVPMTRPRGPITAQFTSATPTYSVEIISAYASVTPAPATYAYEAGQSVTFSAADVIGADTRHLCTGYTVTGATNQTGSGNSFALSITGNLTVTWHWKTQYLLSTTANGPGSVSTGEGQWIDANAPVTINATAGEGANFVAWSGDVAAGAANGAQFTIAAMTRPVGPLTANFAAAMYTLTIVSNETTTTPAAGAHAIAHGTTVDFSAISAEANGTRQRPIGWTLTGATTLTGSEPAGSFVIRGDTTLTWNWTPEVLLSISAGAEGLVLPMDAAGWYPLGGSVALTAAPAPWFTFRAWTGDVPADATGASLALVMNQPRSITADLAPLMTNDGTPHWWLERFTEALNLDFETARLNDSDGDGRRAQEEFIAGTSDLDAQDRPESSGLMLSADGATLRLEISMRAGRYYQLMESSDLASVFTPAGDLLKGVPPSAELSFAKPTNAPNKFYKVQISLGSVGPRDADPAAKSHTPQPDSVVREMMPIPAGSFTQGDNTGPVTARPAHLTHVAAFFMDKYEVTRGDWEEVAAWAREHGYDIPLTLRYNQPPYNVPADHPAVAVSWYDAVKWCNARSEMEGRRPVYFTDVNGVNVYRTGQVDLTAAHVNWAGDGYRLPTEAEWERASRGGLEGKAYPWGDGDAALRANHWNYQLFTGRAPNSEFPYTERVGNFDGEQPGGAAAGTNAFGIYDMTGNAWEWTWDRMSDYTADTQYDPHGPDTGVERVQRGGSWWNYVDQATNFHRLPFPPDGSDDYGMNGFRCVRAMHPNE